MLRLFEKRDDKVKRLENDLKHARDAANLLLQTKVAEAMATRMLKLYNRDFVELQNYVHNGIIKKASIVQKMPNALAFYRKLILGYELAPKRILEIGVKGGGSLVLWRELFPEAEIVGLDIKLPKMPPPERVSFVRGDQSDHSVLAKLARDYGPFDLVIDDGSHVSEDQRKTFCFLIDHLTEGALYVIEDIEAVNADTSKGKVHYGNDIWGDFIRAAFSMFQRGNYQELPVHEDLSPILPRITDIIMSETLFAMQVGCRPMPENS